MMTASAVVDECGNLSLKFPPALKYTEICTPLIETLSKHPLHIKRTEIFTLLIETLFQIIFCRGERVSL